MTETDAPPVQTYETRRALHAGEVSRLEGIDRRLGNAKLAVFGLCLLAAWPTVVSRVLSLWVVVVPAAIFLGLVVLHARTVGSLERVRRRADFYRRGLARARGDAEYVPLDDGTAFRDADHPYSEDLDLFGPGSLYARLCTAYTQPGRETLAGWLAQGADGETIGERQVAVEELSGRLDLREELAVLAADLSPRIGAAELDDWGAAPALLIGVWGPGLAAAVAAVNLFTVTGWLFFDLDRLWLLGSLALTGALALSFRGRVVGVLSGATRPASELRFLAALLRRFEAEPVESATLVHLQRHTADGKGRPSQRIAQLAQLLEWNDSRRNQLFLPIASTLLLGTQLAFAIERWRRRNGASAGDWLRAVGEIEALQALATLRYENRGFIFPEIAIDGPRFSARGLAHPLLPAAARVTNDVDLSSERQLLLVSGSNMSGKSTLLRSVGVAAVMAFAGAPVCAEQLRISVARVAASLHVQDSLTSGVSRFYAELQRLGRVRELAAAGPTLFLLDEVLHGTNSHDRRIGATGIIRMLLEAGAMGLVTTHDLALAAVADELSPRAQNVHFEDHLEAGKMAFDYRLRPGPIERGNALALMRSLGLAVGEAD